MVTEERQKFPFDIQHRHIINYKTASKSDFEKLEVNIKEKLLALLGKQKSVVKIIDNVVKESSGLKQHELTMLLMIVENQISHEESVSVYSLKNDMDKAGFNAIATSLAIRELKRKGFIDTLTEYSNFNSQEYLACKLTQLGEEWILNNQNIIEFKKNSEVITFDDNLPF